MRHLFRLPIRLRVLSDTFSMPKLTLLLRCFLRDRPWIWVINALLHLWTFLWSWFPFIVWVCMFMLRSFPFLRCLISSDLILHFFTLFLRPSSPLAIVSRLCSTFKSALRWFSHPIRSLILNVTTLWCLNLIRRSHYSFKSLLSVLRTKSLLFNILSILY